LSRGSPRGRARRSGSPELRGGNAIRGAVIYAPGDVRVEQRDDPTIIDPTDAVIRLAATCICGSDLWAWRGTDPVVLLAASDVLGTGWFGAVAADVKPGKTVAVVGDGAVGLLAVLAARQLGAERIIAMSRHQPRQKLALEFGATDIATERGEAGVARIRDMTGGYGAHSVIEAVGTQESMMQAIRSARPGEHVGYVGVSHGVQLPGEELFFAEVHLHGGPAPVRRFLPDLIRRIEDRTINPGAVFDLTLPLDQAAEGYRAMDERRAVKTLLQP
jgi:threonine dehydrogenase-like Zn-dependent dehydrogenase